MSPKQYWWLNASLGKWDLESMPEGKKEWYSGHNENGNKRRIYKWFQEVKPGEIALGYVTSPRKKVVAVCEITKGLHPSRGGNDRIDFKIIKKLRNPVAYESLKRTPELSTCEPLLRRQGSLFKLTKDEYEIILGLETADSNLIADVEKIQADKKIGKTTKRALINARLGQGKYAYDVRELWDNRCSVTNSCTTAALEASHIKSWADSNTIERLDPRNGLLLTANLHKLFDAHLVTFEDSGKLLVSSKLSGTERRIFGIIGKKLIKKPAAATARYLADHRRAFFKNEGLRRI